MPQMAPIGWLSLFIVFTISFMLFNMMNYYSNTPISPKSSNGTSHIPQTMTWKW